MVEANMTKARFHEEMGVVLESTNQELHPVFDMLNGLPDTPEVKILKSDLNNIIRSPFVRPRNPMTVMQEMVHALVDVIEYYHNSRGKKTRRQIKPLESENDLESLKEISPQNVNQRRAMTLLVLLKARPKEALHTDDCKKILEGAEGTALDSTIVRRAMCVLAVIYNPKIVYEKVDGSYRVRANF
jgi:hypothetical protein